MNTRYTMDPKDEPEDLEKLLSHMTEGQMGETLALTFNEMGEVKAVEAVMKNLRHMSQRRIAEIIVYWITRHYQGEKLDDQT